jgi:diguanylate cyclase (GGDEF)-like protein
MVECRKAIAPVMDSPKNPPAPKPLRAPGRLPWAMAMAGVAASGSALWLWAAPELAWLLPMAVGALAAAAVWFLPEAAAAVSAEAPARQASDADLRDAETGMFHRPAFLALAQRDWTRAGRYGGAVALLLVEVDRLRSMTDHAGPAVANTLLGGLGKQVAASLRAADLLARFDAAQLAVFLPHADPTGALDVADRIRAMVEHLSLPGLPDGATFSASIGVAVLQPLHDPLKVLVASAQQALQTARQAGGNCVRMAPGPADLPAGGSGRWVGGDASRPSRDGDA